MSQKYKVLVVQVVLLPKYLINFKYVLRTFKILRSDMTVERMNTSSFITEKPTCVITVLLAGHNLHSSQCKQIANNYGIKQI